MNTFKKAALLIFLFSHGTSYTSGTSNKNEQSQITSMQRAKNLAYLVPSKIWGYRYWLLGAYFFNEYKNAKFVNSLGQIQSQQFDQVCNGGGCGQGNPYTAIAPTSIDSIRISYKTWLASQLLTLVLKFKTWIANT